MRPQHAPGPWYACGDEVLIDMGDRAHLVATVADWSEDTERYACLMAAAPELLEALQETVVALKHFQNALYVRVNPGTVEKAEAAISRALGQ